VGNIARLAINEALMFLRRIGAVREVSIDDANNAEGEQSVSPTTRYALSLAVRSWLRGPDWDRESRWTN